MNSTTTNLPFNPSTLAILCHNTLQAIETNSSAFPGVPNYTILSSEPATKDFFFSALTYIVSQFGIATPETALESPTTIQDYLNALGPDLADLVTICKRIAYRSPHAPKDDLSRVNPYADYDLPTLLSYTSQSHHTLKHYSNYVLTHKVNDHFSTPAAARNFLATFHNVRFATVAYAVETARLPAITPHFINRHVFAQAVAHLHGYDHAIM